MVNKIKIIFLMICIIFFNSCTNNNQSNEIKSYFSILKLIDHQIKLLSENKNIKIVKYSMLSHLKSKNEIDKINWQNEFELLKSLDINKVNCINEYKIDSIFDQNSLSQLNYTLLSNQNLKVKWLKISFKDAKIKSIESMISTKNIFAKDKKNIIVDFDNQQMINQYTINGSFSRLFSDEQKFEVKTNIYK